MCLNCGCGEPSNDQGRVENLTIDELRKAAEANHQTLRESAQHILETTEAYERSEGTASSRPSRAAGDPAPLRTPTGDHAGLAQPAGHQPAPAAPRGAPETES